MKINRLNKRGDVPITLLVIGVFAICTLALLSFFLANLKIEKAFSGVSLMENVNSIAEKIKFYEINSLNVDFGETKNGDSILKTEKKEDYYSIIGQYKISEGFAFWKKEKNLIEIEYRLPLE
jgi:hypothetical protein